MDSIALVKFVSNGVDKAKGGEAQAIYNAIAPYHDDGSLPQRSHYAFGWIIYYALHQSPENAVIERKRMLGRYLALRVARPHKLHSMILTEAIRLYKDSAYRRDAAVDPKGEYPHFSIVRFMEWWEFANLRPGDRKRKEHNGRELPSTLEKLITHYVHELSEKNQPPSPEFMKEALEMQHLNPGSHTLCAQISRLYELSGEREKAVEMLRNAILSSSDHPFLWNRLAMLIDDPARLRLKISLLYRALLSPGPEEYKGKIHLRLAEALAGGGAYGQAAEELIFVKELYAGHGWNLPRLYHDTLKLISADTAPVDPLPAYRKIAHMADEYIYDAIPDLRVKKTYHKSPSISTDARGRRKENPAAWRVTDSEGNNYWLTPGRHGISPDLPAETILMVKIHNGKILRATLPKNQTT